MDNNWNTMENIEQDVLSYFQRADGSIVKGIFNGYGVVSGDEFYYHIRFDKWKPVET